MIPIDFDSTPDYNNTPPFPIIIKSDEHPRQQQVLKTREEQTSNLHPSPGQQTRRVSVPRKKPLLPNRAVPHHHHLPLQVLRECQLSPLLEDQKSLLV